MMVTFDSCVLACVREDSKENPLISPTTREVLDRIYKHGFDAARRYYRNRGMMQQASQVRIARQLLAVTSVGF